MKHAIRSLPIAALLFAALSSQPAAVQGGTLSLATEPLAVATTGSVLPNLMLVLDDSGSMKLTILGASQIGNLDTGPMVLTIDASRNSSCNYVYYNPAITYTPPLYGNGTSFSNQTFTAALYDGYTSSSTKVDLSKNFQADLFVPSGGGTDTEQAAYYYSYTAGGTPKQGDCTQPNSSYTKITVSSTSGPGSTDERTNFANWFSYYRTHMLMMKTALTQAFKQIGNSYRVGYMSIDNTTGSDFLNIATFDSTQKTNWYNKVIAATPGATTPTRSALSTAGLIYAGRMNGTKLNGTAVVDPMQYSCQQNFALLATDGYWNTGNDSGCSGQNGAGCTLAMNAGVGEQDGYPTLRPMYDGASTTITLTYTDTAPATQVTPATQTDKCTRTDTRTNTSTTTGGTIKYTKSVVTYGASCTTGGHAGTKVTIADTTNQSVAGTQTTTTPQSRTATVTTTTPETITATGTDTWTETVTQVNGVVTNDANGTPTFSSSSSSTSTGTPSPSESDGSWSSGTASNSYSSGTVTFTSGSAPSAESGVCTANTSLPAAGTFDYETSFSGGTTSTTTGATVDGATCNESSGYPTTADGTAQNTKGSPITKTLNSTSNPATSGGSSNSLADVAMYYYTTDLRTSALNNCTSPTTGNDVCANNVPGTSADNNNQQHMTTFTLGLGINGDLTYSPTYLTDKTGDYCQILHGDFTDCNPNGTATDDGIRNWPVPISDDPTAVDDLWHAAVDGHGQYFSATNPTSLVQSLNSALAGVSARLGHGTAAATSTLAPVTGNNAIYIASYTTQQWTGNVRAMTIDPTTGNAGNTITWCAESIAQDTTNNIAACNGTLDTQVGASSDTRTIYFLKNGALTSFEYANLPTAQQAYFNPANLSQYSAYYSASDKTTASGTNLVDYLRGQTQYQNQSGSVANLYRSRNFNGEVTLGDVVDSPPVYVQTPFFDYLDPGYANFVTAKSGRTGVLYVGANDGMLHAFNASTGVELWAYIPTAVMSNMYKLADFNYGTNHEFLVDGPITVADVCKSHCTDGASADWHTILVGAFGAGGVGYYALDVTNPANPVPLWEMTGSSVGYAFGNPLAVKRPDGSWVIVVSSGYDNGADAYLYVLDPFAGTVLTQIDTGGGNNSGLAKISAWTNDPIHDVTAQYVYGGDLSGNLWRFDISTTLAPPTPPASSTSRVLQIASLVDAAGNPQPVTTTPELGSVTSDNTTYYNAVFVATGQMLQTADLTNTATQSIYAIKDDGTTLANCRGSSMIQQTLTDTATNTRTVTANKVDWSKDRGWYANFPDSGERANIDMYLLLGTLVVATNVPTNGTCVAGGYSWLNYLNYDTGSYVTGASTVGAEAGNDMTVGLTLYWITNGQGGYSPYVSRLGSGSELPSAPAGGQPPYSSSGGTGGGGAASLAPVSGHRVTWRELIQ